SGPDGAYDCPSWISKQLAALFRGKACLNPPFKLPRAETLFLREKRGVAEHLLVSRGLDPVF
ncbi:MAG: hypothetical protein VX178_10280, partial [Pseudomonadota bacterium]|nr:hypothetical protein [Pseudomonadota bacterium]